MSVYDDQQGDWVDWFMERIVCPIIWVIVITFLLGLLAFGVR